MAKQSKFKGVGPHWPAGNTPLNVGSYTRIKPKIDVSQCSGCRLCFVFCPDGAITMQDDKDPVVDFNLCKACGICVNECPKKIIEMTTVESNA